MCHRRESIITFVLFLSTILPANGEEINLPSKDKDIYVASESRLYNLKAGLSPKIVESRVYWGGRERINWQEEIDNWHFGFLSKDEIVPPIIIDKEYFYPGQKDYSEKYPLVRKNMQISVFNPVKTKVQTYLEFSLNPYNLQRILEVWMADRKIKKIKVPIKETPSHFKIDKIPLEPGINKIIFFSSEGGSSLGLKKWEEKGLPKEASIKFKNPRTIQPAEFEKGDSVARCIPQDNFVDILFLIDEPVIFSRNIDVDLEEFPFLNLDTEFNRETNNKLIAFLGIDYTEDGLIDDYLDLEKSGEYNLFELAKDKWSGIDTYENYFKFKKIIFLILPGKDMPIEKQIGILRLNHLTLYGNKSLMLVKEEFGKDQLRFRDVNSKSEIFSSTEKKFYIITCFDSAFFKSKKGKFIDREFAETQAFISMKGIDWKNFPYFSFRYKLDNLEFQDIELAISAKDKHKKRTFYLTKDQYKRSEEKIEVNLRDVNSEGLEIEHLIIRLKRRAALNYSVPGAKGWYQFQLNDLKLYEKFPYPIKSRKAKERFLDLIQGINIKLLKIDEKRLGLNDFQEWRSCEALNERFFYKHNIELVKGKHTYEKLENDTLNVDAIIIEPALVPQVSATSKWPEINFKKINPTKYLVEIKNAKGPFWLVFSESFHEQWCLYQASKEIISEYTDLRAEETRDTMRPTMEDIKYLFRKPLNPQHHLVNGYANGWYIKPEELGLGENFVFVIYFWLQSLFYLGLAISGSTFLGCICYLLWPKKRREEK